MPGLVPGIHGSATDFDQRVDGRVKPGPRDTDGRVKPGHDDEKGDQFPSEISIPRLVAGRAISSSYQRLTLG